MDEIATQESGIGKRKASMRQGWFSAMLPDSYKADAHDCSDGSSKSGNPSETDRLLPRRKRTSILQAERQAKVIALIALVTGVYFAQNTISLPELILSFRHSVDVSKSAATKVVTTGNHSPTRP